MRVAAFRVQGKEGKQADIGVVPVPDLAGHDLENVNRWRGGVGLAPVTEADLGKLAETVEIGGQTGVLYDQAGENPGSGEKSRILVAVLRREGTAWFFKMNGDDELVAQQKPAFVDFLKSLSFEAAAGGPELPPSHPPVGDAGTLAAQPMPSHGPRQEKPNWQVPTGWREIPGGAFLVAKFSVGGSQNLPTAVNVSMSPGEGGGLLMNVNRWRGQLGLGQVSDAELTPQLTTVDTAGGKAMFIDMTGTDARSGQKARLIGAIVRQAEQTWFYKLMGDAQVVEREKDAFTRFVQGVKYQP